MHIGHINLAQSPGAEGKRFVSLIESLQQLAVQQFVLVRDVHMARRLRVIDGVVVGPTVRSPITAYCLTPDVDIVHIHDSTGSSAGLLLTLTRSIPFILTRNQSVDPTLNPVNKAIHKRARGYIEKHQYSAVEHLQIYRRAIDSLRIPTMLL